MANNIGQRPVAVVTGAARGIGRACAVALAKDGFNVLLNDLDDGHVCEALKEVSSQLGELGAESEVVLADIGELASHVRMIHAAVERWGRADCLVNNAGVGVMRRGDLLDVTPESFDRCILINTRAVFFLSQLFGKHLLAQGQIGAQHRSIINITSSNAVAVSISRGEYCVSKCASSMTTRLFAARLAESGIGVYEVRPGIIETEMTLPVKEKYDSLIAEGFVPARRWGYPADVAVTVRAMATGQLPYTMGQAITVDGGLTVPRF
jgi:NAD(P)-dependent dehydrogenase (short-subunit alcohol dehydrogenase family)